jgi:hypothetical protein
VEADVPETRRATSLPTHSRNRTVLDIARRPVRQQDLAQHMLFCASHAQFRHVDRHLFLMGVRPRTETGPAGPQPWQPLLRLLSVAAARALPSRVVAVVANPLL